MKQDSSSVNAEDLRYLMREIVREWGLLQAHPCVPALTLVQGHALIEIGTRGARTIADVASRLRIDHSAASRLIAKLAEMGLLKKTTGNDARERTLTLTSKGKEMLGKVDDESNRRVATALSTLAFEDQTAIKEGLSLYAKALTRARLQSKFSIRPIKKSDNAEVEQIVKSVLSYYGGNAPGFAYHDEELSDMWSTYSQPRHRYYVVELDGKVVGGGGVGPLKGGDKGTCELRRMFFLPEARGKGLGEKVLKLALDSAKEFGFKLCYLETTKKMIEANRLYQKAGFTPLSAPLGATGHYGCDSWYAKNLAENENKKAA